MSALGFRSFESCQNPNCQYSTCCTNAMQEHNAKCSKNSSNPVAEEKLPFEMFCICGYSDTDGNQMARHLAICERKSAYPSRKEAKSAIVTHSMLDVLGLVRKPEEGPSGIKKTSPSLVNDNKEKEAVVVEDNEASLGSHTETEQDGERDSKEEDDKMETQEIVAIDVEESGRTDDAGEPEKSETDNQVADANKESEEEKESNEETVGHEENPKIVDEEIKESNEEINRDESQATDKEADEQESEKNEEVEEEKNEQEDRESNGEEDNGRADANSPELEKNEQLESEIRSPEQPVEKAGSFGDAAEKETVQDSSEKESSAGEAKSRDETSEGAELDENVPGEEKSVSPVPQEATDEQEPPHEPYSAPVEKITGASEMETTEGVRDKQNTLDSEITSDDIQNLISDVVGGKSNSEMNFDDVQNLDEAQSMETETENMISNRTEDVNMQITQGESMEVLQTDAAMESVVTPMETD